MLSLLQHYAPQMHRQKVQTDPAAEQKTVPQQTGQGLMASSCGYFNNQKLSQDDLRHVGMGEGRGGKDLHVLRRRQSGASR